MLGREPGGVQAEQLRRCALVLETRLEDAGVRLDLSLDDAHVCGNADYLMQVWMNLLATPSSSRRRGAV